MKQIFLTSSVSDVAKDFVKYLKDSPNNLKLVFINTAAEVEEGDKQWLANDKKALLDVGFKVDDYTLTEQTKQGLK